MRLRANGRAIALAVLSAGLVAGLVACFDLFHSTSGILSACDLDAQACQDGATTQADAETGDSGTDFCSFTPLEALANAQHACAWLGACETPMGNNAFGTCMFDALLAYDCSANPGHPVRGKAHALWDCLWQVQSCGDVTRCVFPGGSATCQGGDFVACGNAGGGLPANADVRIECVNGMAVGENCALVGQTCAGGSSTGTCAGAALAAADAADAGGAGCTTECTGTHLHQCAAGVDVGIDCADNGAGVCGGFPDEGGAGVQWVACVASGDGGCAPSDQATCSASGYAESCPSGVPESVYCPELLQVATGGCVSGPLLPNFDWTSPCVVNPPMCTGDSCDGGLVGCARGAPYPLDCASQGLGPCAMVSTDVGTAMHAACTQMSPP